MALCLAEVSELAQAAGGFAGERPVIEMADPRRPLIGRRDREHPFGLKKVLYTVLGTPKRCESTRLHGEDAGFKLRLPRSTGERFSATHGEPDGVGWIATVVCQMTHAGQDVYAELAVTTKADEFERPSKVLLGGLVASSVVSHPSGHFSQRGGGRKDELPAVVVIDTKEARRDLYL